MFKQLMLLSLVSLLIGLGSAAQPKILAMEDNLGNEYNITSSGPDDTFGGRSYEGEIVVTDNTKISLCVTEVKAENPDNLTFSWYAPHYDEFQRHGKCASWNMNRSDYSPDWKFIVQVDNGDNIKMSGDGDFQVFIEYDNLTLSDSKDNSRKFQYNVVQIGQDRYNEMQNKIENKNERISQLESEIEGLQSTISDLRNTVNRLKESESDGKDGSKNEKDNSGFFGFLGNLF